MKRCTRIGARSLSAVLVVASMALMGCDSVEDRVAKHYERGLQLLERGETRRAQLEFRNAVRLDDDHAPSRFEIARLYEQAQQYRAAVGNYRRVAEIDPAHLESRLRLAEILGAGGVTDEALTYAEQALALAPDNPDVLAARAAIAWRLDDRETAVAMARRALEIAPDSIPATIVLATERMAAAAQDEALALLDGQLERSPEDERLNLIRLSVLQQMGDIEGMQGHLRRMTELYPDNLQVRQALVQLFVQTGQDANAEAELRAIAEANPEDDEALLSVARFVAETRGMDAARAELERLIGARDGVVAQMPFIMALSDIELREGDVEGARARLRAVVESDGAGEAGRMARLRLARIALASNDRETARALVDVVLEQNDAQVEALALKGAILNLDSRTDESIPLLRRAADIEPENIDVLLTLGQAFELAGSPDLGGERYAAAMRVSNYAPQPTLRYAAFLRGRNQIDGAEAILVESARRNPASIEPLAALAELRLGKNDWAGAQEAARQLAALGAAAPAQRIAAASLAAQGRGADSVRLLEELVAEDGGGAALAALVAAYVGSGEEERGRALVAETLAREPDNLAAQLLSAEFEVRDGDVAAAEARLRAMIDARPAEHVGYAALGRLLLLLDRAEDAIVALEAGVAAGVGNDSQLRFPLAQLYEQRGEFDLAIAHYSALHQRQPGSAVIANNLASLIAEHRADDPEQIAFANRVAQRLRGSDVPHFQDTYGWLRFLAGDTDAALRNLIPAAQALPNMAIVRYHLGRAYAAVGRPAEARAELEAALAADANFPKAESARETLAGLPTQ